MSGARIKNLILLILALAVCFLLLAVVPGKLSASHEETAIHEQLTELLAAYGVTLDPEALGQSEILYTVELGGADAAGVAAALLGTEGALDAQSTRYELLYSASTGTVLFSRSGVLHAELCVPISGKSYERDLQRRLRGMGYAVWQTLPAVRQEDGVYALTVTQALLGQPLFGAQLTFSYRDSQLVAVDGLFYPETENPTRVSEESCISCADALLQILASRDATGWVGSQITAVRQGYLHAETATAALRFTPVWRVETDTVVFYVNGITREVRQAERRDEAFGIVKSQ